MDEVMKWRKSRHSGNGGANCVELADAGGAVALRDSKNPDDPHHKFSIAAMTELFDEIRRGRYDLS